MPAIINTNIASLNAQRNLNSSQSALQTSLQRLSSGLRINSAKDDAAGLAISERFSTQIRGLNQAARNANDGISLAQTGEGALAAVTDNLQRIRELAVQAANSTNSANDRAAIQLEVAQRLAEIDRTASQTSFNGQKLLDGSFQTANFQIGANAGEVIGIDLQTNARINSIGAISTTTSNVLGGTTTGGSIVTGAVTPANFGVTAQAATSGQISFTPSTFNFGVAATAQVDGKNSVAGATLLAYDYSAAAAVVGNNVQALTGAGGAHDFSVTQGQFDLSDGTNTATVTLTGNYANDAALVAAINAQTGGNFTASVVGGNLKIVGATAGAVAVTNVDAQAQTVLGLAATNAGYAGGANQNATFTVDGTAVTLNTAVTVAGNGTGAGTTIAAVNAALTAAGLVGYTAAADTTGFKITHTGSTTAVAITGANASAVNNGILNSAGTAGTPAVSSTNATFTADGQAVTLNTSYASFTAMAADIATQMNTAVPGTYTVTNNAGTLTIAKVATGAASTAVNITATTGFATSAGINVAAGTAGANAVAATNALVTVDGKQLSLTGNATNLTDVQTNLQAALDAAVPTGFGAGAYTVNISGTGLQILNNTAGSAAVSLTADNAAAVTAGFGALGVPATGTAGIAGGTVTVANLSINGTAITAQTYASTAALATAINSTVAGVYASVAGGGTNGALTLSSSAALTLAGTDVATLGLNGGLAGTVAANSGSLTTATVATTADANLTIQRIDAALNTVSNLRSTFGAVQNRFESVISSLSATSENLTAARSRIQDTDFAAETAQLTRNQILQQAGTAMLAQANQLPNTVLSLLR